MFGAVGTVKAQVFARLPDRFRRGNVRSAWGEANRAGRAVDSFLEGPSFDREGNLYVVDIPFGRVFRVSPEAEFELVSEYDGEPNGLRVHKSGEIFIADYRRGIVKLDPASGSVEPIIERRYSERFKGVNDLMFASNGDLYFTDQGQTGMQDPTGRVFRLSNSGRLELLIDTVPSPNGLVLSPDERVLYVAVTRANNVWRLPLHADGGTSKVGVFVQLSGGFGGPDGLAMNEEGGLIVAHAGLGVVWVFSALGEPVVRVETCAGLATTNIAFGGADGRRLYITESDTGTILYADLEVAGARLFSHQ